MTTQGLNENYESLARSVAARLSESTASLPHEVTERLRAARFQALAKRKMGVPAMAPVTATVAAQPTFVAAGVGESGPLESGQREGFVWSWISSLLALLVLVVGLVTITTIQDDIRTRELAEIDAELLTDVLPPAAYTDPGFVQFLRSAPGH
jgi:hypothetical protein